MRTIYEIYWRAEKYRQVIGNNAGAVQSLFLVEAARWSYDQIEHRRAKLEVLGNIFISIDNFGPSHPWWGFWPRPLIPGDDETIGRIMLDTLKLAQELANNISQFQNRLGLDEEPSILHLEKLLEEIEELPELPPVIIEELLSRIFNVPEKQRHRNIEIVSDVIVKIKCAKELTAESEKMLGANYESPYNEVMPVVEECIKKLSPSVLNATLEELTSWISGVNWKVDRIREIVSKTPGFSAQIVSPNLEMVDAKLATVALLDILDQPIGNIRKGSEIVIQEIDHLRHSLEKISAITSQWEIEFDNSTEAITRLAQSRGIESVLPGIQIDELVVEESLKFANWSFADRPITELHNLLQTLESIHLRCSMAFEEIDEYAHRLDIPFDGSQKSAQFLNFLCFIAEKAPFELLDYRHLPFQYSITSEVLDAIEQSFTIEETQRTSLSKEFYLDELPSIDDLKTLIRIFRKGDHFFNLFKSEWRSAKKVIKTISKNKKKKKATEHETEISKIVYWLEYQTILLANDEFKSTIGPLYKGLNTDFSKIRRLYSWYSESQEELLKYQEFIDSSFSLSEIASVKLSSIRTISARLKKILSEFYFCLSEVKSIMPPPFPQNKEVRNKKRWDDVNQEILQTIENLRGTISFFNRYVSPQISPFRATQILKGQLELFRAEREINDLYQGVEKVRQNTGLLLPGILDISCSYFDQYIDQIFDLSCSAKNLSEILEEYTSKEMSPKAAREFFQTKSDLEELYQKFGNFLPEIMMSGWNVYISEISKGTNAGERLIKAFKNAPLEKTVNQVLNGIKARREASQVIDGLSKDRFVKDNIKNYFQGIETDIEALASTLFWGETIIKNKMISESSIKDILLSIGINYNLKWIKDLLSQSFQFYEGIQQKLEELNGFGVIKWDLWNYFPSRQLSASNLLKRIKIAADDVQSVLPWSKYISERSDCERMGLSDFVIGLERKDIFPTSISDCFHFVVYRSIGRSIFKKFPELERFSGVEHEKMRMEFAALDNEIIAMTGKSFANEINKATSVPPGDTGYRASERTEFQLILHELGKQRRHIPIRQLIKRAGHAIQALKPCFMMGPMSVAQYIEHGSVEFDIIVMDEASQLRPEEALGAIARGKQLIVVGDPKQLPPTSFFDKIVDSGDDEDEDVPAALVGSESILDICQQLFHPIRTLRWHYRSRHESLIAFSNHEFYNNKLLVFPSPFGRNNRLGLKYRFIKNGIYKDRQNIPEAQRVVDAVIEHMMEYLNSEDGSLGVVTLNLTQRDLIEDLLDKKIRSIEEAQKFISKWEGKGWPFFVKNLENVQGDERDVVFISTTFGKAPGTNIPRQNFGPISRPDGWRRLNVLFTRARQKTEVFTSMQPEDIILETKTPAGTKALRGYLDFAKRGVIGAVDITERDPDSDFEIAVGDMLRNRGFEIVPQLGVAGFFIDIAVRNPDRPGEFLAAIECDGVTYHSSKSARDRDRIRQSVLESLGWKDRIWRIWSTDWFYDPRGESKKLIGFLDERRAIAAASEPPPAYDIYEEIIIDEAELTPKDSMGEVHEASREVFKEDYFVEVGDTVTYCFTDKSKDQKIVTIVEGQSIADIHLINEDAPLAKVLLGMSVGDTEMFEVHGHPSREVQVLKIQRGGVE